MVFVACGLNHKTAPLSMREQMAIPVSMQAQLLTDLMDLPTVHEAAILSTCNRMELYCDTNDPDSIAPWLADSHKLHPNVISPYFYLHQGHQALRHTLRVASGLDSMMIGEPQIFGQMKQAYQQACQVGSVKTNLRHVFDYVFRATKRIRTDSGIGNNPVSIAYAAVQLITQTFSDLTPLNVFIIGSGDTSSLVAKYLKKEGVQRFMVASRTHENSVILAENIDAKALTIGDIPHHLAEADIVISATSCPLPFINKSLVQHALDQRKHAPMFFLDLAMPRDIETNVGELDGVHLYNLDDLQNVVTKGMDKRHTAAEQAEQLIDTELNNYIHQRRALKAKDVICNYRNQMQQIAQQELMRAKQKLSAGKCQHSVLEELTDRLVNKLTHAPTLGLRHAAQNNRKELLDLAQYLLDDVPYEKIT